MEKECTKCNIKLYENISLEINRAMSYICPKCSARVIIWSFIFVIMVLFSPLPDVSWIWLIKVIALVCMAALLQGFVICLPYYLKLKK